MEDKKTPINIYESWVQLYKLHKDAERTLYKLTSHPNATDEQIISATRVRASARRDFEALSYLTVKKLQSKRSILTESWARKILQVIGDPNEPLPIEALDKMRALADKHSQLLENMKPTDSPKYESDGRPLSPEQLEQLQASLEGPKGSLKTKSSLSL